MNIQYFIDRNQQLADHYQGKLDEIEQGTYQHDGTMPEQCIEPMYQNKLLNLLEANLYLQKLKKEAGHDRELTGDEAYHVRAILNGMATRFN